MTSSRGASLSGDRCMSVTIDTKRPRLHPGRWRRRQTAVTCQNLSDKNQWGVLLLSGDMYTQTHTHTVCKAITVIVCSYLALMLALSLINCTPEN